MRWFFTFFILSNSVFNFSNAFTVMPSLRIGKCSNSISMSYSRRDALNTIGKISTIGASSFFSNNIPSFALDSDINDAREDDADKYGDWTQHKGAYSENDLGEYTKTSSGLLYKDIKVGTGSFPNAGDAVTIQMVGYIFETGEKWCNTYKGIPAFQSIVRAGTRENQKYMKGLNEGVLTMRKGGKRVLVIPAYLAYSYTTIFSDKNPDTIIIPGGSNLVCYIEVVDFRKLD